MEAASERTTFLLTGKVRRHAAMASGQVCCNGRGIRRAMRRPCFLCGGGWVQRGRRAGGASESAAGVGRGGLRVGGGICWKSFFLFLHDVPEEEEEKGSDLTA